MVDRPDADTANPGPTVPAEASKLECHGARLANDLDLCGDLVTVACLHEAGQVLAEGATAASLGDQLGRVSAVIARTSYVEVRVGYPAGSPEPSALLESRVAYQLGPNHRRLRDRHRLRLDHRTGGMCGMPARLSVTEGGGDGCRYPDRETRGEDDGGATNGSRCHEVDLRSGGLLTRHLEIDGHLALLPSPFG
jgi:hypothetical protein